MGRRCYETEFPSLEPMGLKACDIRADGNCMFNALSDQIVGHQDDNRKIRSKVVAFMRENRHLFISFVNVDGNRRNPKRKNVAAASSFYATPATEDEQNAAYESHLNSMAQSGTYGGNLEVLAFAKAYNTDVKIYTSGTPYYVRAEDDDGAKVRPVAHIAYHNWEHYSSVRNIIGPFAGLPKVQIKVASAEQPDKAHAVRKLLDSDSSNPTSPASSADSTSIERDLDSDDEEEIRGSSKRQNRRLQEARKIGKGGQKGKRRVNDAVNKLPDSDSSNPQSPASSASSISIDPLLDSDDDDEDEIRRPTSVRENRRIKEARKLEKQKKLLEKTTRITPEITTGSTTDPEKRNSAPVESVVAMRTLYI